MKKAFAMCVYEKIYGNQICGFRFDFAYAKMLKAVFMLTKVHVVNKKKVICNSCKTNGIFLFIYYSENTFNCYFYI